MSKADLEAVAGTGTTLSGLVKGVTRNFQVLKISGDKVELEIHIPTSGNFKDSVKVSDIVLPGDPEQGTKAPKDSRWYDEQAQANLKAQGEDRDRVQSQTAPSKAEADSAAQSSSSQGGSKSSSSSSQGGRSSSSSSSGSSS